MEKTILISLPIEDLQTVIIDCVNSCLKNSKYIHNEPQPNPEHWFDLNQLVAYDPEQRTKPTFYGYIHRGEIPSHKRGKKLTFLKSEIDAWLKQGRRKTVLETANEAETYLKNKGGKAL